MSATGRLPGLNIEYQAAKSRWVGGRRGLSVGLGGGVLQSLALGAPITHGTGHRRSVWPGVRHSFCAPRHQRRRRIDLGTGGCVSDVVGLPRWTASALDQRFSLDGGPG